MIKVFQPFLPQPLFNQCTQYSESRLLTRGPQSRSLYTSYLWSSDVVHDSPPVLIHELPTNDILFKSIQDATVEKLGDLIDRKPHTIQFTYWPVHSYIPWHNDAAHYAAVTIYLNRNWYSNFGGLFLYNEGDGIRGVTPKANLGIFQGNSVMHATTPVYPRGKLRRTLQIWFGHPK